MKEKIKKFNKKKVLREAAEIKNQSTIRWQRMEKHLEVMGEDMRFLFKTLTTQVANMGGPNGRHYQPAPRLCGKMT
jgi:hypothetical protein